MFMLLVSLWFVLMHAGENEIEKSWTEQKRKKKKKSLVNEEGMKVSLIAHMHFKEGRSFAVPSPQREQNERSLQDAFKILTQKENVDPKPVFRVLWLNNSESNKGCG